MNASATRPAATFVAATLLTFLKPRLKKNLRPWVAYLARSGVTANQVTVTSLIGSVVVGGLLCVFAAEGGLFVILPAWLAARTACATIDGTLAIEFGQKSRLGGILNEAGDIISKIALFMPLMFVSPFWATGISLLIALFVASELAGIVPTMAGGERRLEGPLGKGRPVENSVSHRDRGIWPASRERLYPCADALRRRDRHDRQSRAFCYS